MYYCTVYCSTVLLYHNTVYCVSTLMPYIVNSYTDVCSTALYRCAVSLRMLLYRGVALVPILIHCEWFIHYMCYTQQCSEVHESALQYTALQESVV